MVNIFAMIRNVWCVDFNKELLRAWSWSMIQNVPKHQSNNSRQCGLNRVQNGRALAVLMDGNFVNYNDNRKVYCNFYWRRTRSLKEEQWFANLTTELWIVKYFLVNPPGGCQKGTGMFLLASDWPNNGLVAAIVVREESSVLFWEWENGYLSLFSR